MDRYHSAIHTDAKNGGEHAKCEICGMPTGDRRKSPYRLHMMTHMNEEEKKEALLLHGHQYKQLPTLPHSSSSSTSSINQCQTCGQFITNGENGMRHHELDSHPELHEPQVKSFLCTICGHSLSTKQGLDHHIRAKHPDGDDGKQHEPFKCKFPSCPKNLSDELSLKEHIQDEHGKSEAASTGVLCKICGKVLTVPWILKQHGLIHSGERAHKCHLCPKSYPLKNTLDLHLTTKHGIGTQVFKCEEEGCGKLFSNRIYFGVHMRKVHRVFSKKPKSSQRAEHNDAD